METSLQKIRLKTAEERGVASRKRELRLKKASTPFSVVPIISSSVSIRVHPWLKHSGFTRLDLLCLVGTCVVIAAWFGAMRLGEAGRTAHCKQNLAYLYQLTEQYSEDHHGTIPPAIIAKPATTWDMQLISYLPRSKVTAGVDPFFRCPSDRVERMRPRSYAMSAHDMRPENWPLGNESDTGVGLIWNEYTIKLLLGDKMSEAAMTNVEVLSMVKLSGLPAPADTLFLADTPNRGNNLKQLGHAAVSSAGEQLESVKSTGPIHSGRFNYLMTDGHTELLSPLQTGSSGGVDIDTHGGIWTVKAED